MGLLYHQAKEPGWGPNTEPEAGGQEPAEAEQRCSQTSSPECELPGARQEVTQRSDQLQTMGLAPSVSHYSGDGGGFELRRTGVNGEAMGNLLTLSFLWC